MARDEHPREDLLAEAKALVERVSLDLAGHDPPLVIGFRRDGSASFYFGPDRVYQFTSTGQLRRAFVSELMFKAEQGRLVALRRVRSEHAVELVRHVLDPSAAQAFVQEMRSHLDALRQALANGHFTIVGQVPPEADIVARIGRWLEEFGGRMEIARSPRAG